MFWRTLSHSRECKCFGEPSHSRIKATISVVAFLLGENNENSKIKWKLSEGNNIKIENIAICLFYTLVVNQWFYDGNKRTGFAIMNKILIQNGIGLVLTTEELEKKFSEKLFLCYKEKGEKSKREFIEFIKNYCYRKF